MSIYDLIGEDEDLFYEDIDEAFAEEDEFGERRPRSGRRAPRIQAGRTANGRNLVKPRPSSTPVSTSTLQASLDRVGQDIRTNAAAIKRLEAQVKSATAQLNSVNNTHDKSISVLRNSMQQQNQISMLVPLLQKNLELELKANVVGDDSLEAGGKVITANTILNSVQIKKQDMTLPLVLMMMASQPMTGAGSSNINTILPLVLLMDK